MTWTVPHPAIMEILVGHPEAHPKIPAWRWERVLRVTEPLCGIAATVQCLLEGHFVLVVPRGMVTQPYNLDSVRLASSQAGCEPLHVSEAFVMFRFPVTHCGTTVQVGRENPGEPPGCSQSLQTFRIKDSCTCCLQPQILTCVCPRMFPIPVFFTQVVEDRLIYENQLISTIDVQGSPRGSITRDSVYM